MERTNSKLTLELETLVELTPEQARGVNGGFPIAQPTSTVQHPIRIGPIHGPIVHPTTTVAHPRPVRPVRPVPQPTSTVRFPHHVI